MTIFMSTERPPSGSPPINPDEPVRPARERPLDVLVVEDNWLVALETESSLQDAGYNVLNIAVSAEEAVEMCREQRPDFILMDIRLAGERDGIDAAIEARQRFDIPAIFLSAHDDPTLSRRAEPARPLGWLTKPITPDQLSRRLDRLLASRN